MAKECASRRRVTALRATPVAVLVTLALVFVAVTTASAGEVPYDASISAGCNTQTGQYDVGVSVTNLLDVETAIGSGQYAFVVGSTITSGLANFAPSPVAAGGAAQATLSGPGGAVYVEVGFRIVELDTADTISLELAGDCEVAPTTTASTVEPSTSTTAVVAASVSPRFTG